MTEISRQESSRLIVRDQQMSKDAGEKQVARRRDWLFRTLLALAVIVLIAALTTGILLLFPLTGQQSQLVLPMAQQIIELPAMGWSLFNIVLPSSTFFWPLGLQTGHMVLFILLFLAFAIYLIARQRAVRNRSTWPAAGCPACHEHELFRVHRIRKDLLITRMGIPVARYQCLDCGWNGRRIQRGPNPIPWTHRSSSAFAESEDDSPNGIDPPQNQAPTLFVSPQPVVARDQGVIKAATRCKVIAPLGLNLREEPDSDAALLGTLEPGIIVVSLDSVKGEDGVPWQQVRVKSHKGWVLSAFLKPLQ